MISVRVRLALRVQKMGPIRSTSKRVQHYNVLIKPDLNPTRFWVGLSGSKIRLSQVCPQGQNLGWFGRIVLAALITIPKLDLGFSFHLIPKLCFGHSLIQSALYCVDKTEKIYYLGIRGNHHM